MFARRRQQAEKLRRIEEARLAAPKPQPTEQYEWATDERDGQQKPPQPSEGAIAASAKAAADVKPPKKPKGT